MDVDNADVVVAAEPALTDNNMPDENRRTMLDLFAVACDKHEKWRTIDIETRRSIVRRIERSCHRNTINTCERDRINRTWEEPAFVSRYSACCYRVLSNLDCDSSINSTHLINEIINKRIDPRVAGEISSATLYPKGSATERDIIAIRREQKIQEKFSEKYKCSKCHARKCVWYGVQTRGLDEPEDKHCRCLECGHQWKEGG